MNERKYIFKFRMSEEDLHELRRLATFLNCGTIAEYIRICMVEYSTFVVKSMEEVSEKAIQDQLAERDAATPVVAVTP